MLAGRRTRLPLTGAVAGILIGAALVVGAFGWVPSIRIVSFDINANSAGSSTAAAVAYAIGFRPTNASGALPSVPVVVGPHANLTAMWRLDCGGNASFRCDVTSISVGAPFTLAYSPLGSNCPCVWSVMPGGGSFFESV